MITKDWENIFTQSPANGGVYIEDQYAPNWEWPKETWFRERLRKLKELKKAGIKS